MPLGIPVWAWLVGAGIIVSPFALDQAGDAMEQSGEAAEKAANLTRWLVAGGVLYVGYQAAKKAGAV